MNPDWREGYEKELKANGGRMTFGDKLAEAIGVGFAIFFGLGFLLLLGPGAILLALAGLIILALYVMDWLEQQAKK